MLPHTVCIHDLCFNVLVNLCSTVSLCYSHYSHVGLWLQRDLQHFGPIHHPLHAACGDSLPSDAVDLVESVGFQEPLICCPNEDLQHQWSCSLVPMELEKTTKVLKYMYHSTLK